MSLAAQHQAYPELPITEAKISRSRPSSALCCPPESRSPGPPQPVPAPSTQQFSAPYSSSAAPGPVIGGLYLAPDPPDPQSGAEERKGYRGPGSNRLEPAWPPLFLFLLHLPGSTGASPGPRPPAALRTGVSSCHRLPPLRLNSFPPSTSPGHLLLRPGHPARPPSRPFWRPFFSCLVFPCF